MKVKKAVSGGGPACTLQNSYLRNTSSPANVTTPTPEPSRAADDRGKDKIKPNLYMYVDKALELGMTVCAFNVETYGGWGEQAKNTLKHIQTRGVYLH